ncbi:MULTISPECIES: Zn-ribbon domain-containing OB-fold protein [Salinibaculum]|uniref:Zn-ribbon domain-containing OB-fold protein n=1 Tax=Salinibaculum TaxID=2732368 RepID=UPI0030D4963E
MSDDDRVRDNGYDDFLDAVEEGEPYYLESPSGNGWLPPRQMDPETGERELTQQSLPETGEILTSTITNVAGPSFADDAPFVVAVAQFGPVRITGQVRGMDHDDVDIGQEVTIGVGKNETEGERLVVFEPA